MLVQGRTSHGACSTVPGRRGLTSSSTTKRSRHSWGGRSFSELGHERRILGIELLRPSLIHGGSTGCPRGSRRTAHSWCGTTSRDTIACHVTRWINRQWTSAGVPEGEEEERGRRRTISTRATNDVGGPILGFSAFEFTMSYTSTVPGRDGVR